MFIDTGYFSLILALILGGYSISTLSLGIINNNNNLITSAKTSSLFVLLAVFWAYCSLTYGFLTDDFSIDFVREHSSTDLPFFYKITGVWGGMNGSLLLWELILAFYITIVSFKYSKVNRDILPHSLIVLNVISLFLLFLLLGWSNPLAQKFPSPIEGNGLNPLLQNPGMVIHPPMLYLGFVGYSIPFAFAMGSLMRGKFNNEWILASRKWVLCAWLFNTMGMILGGGWAYLELGWGGYWAWDPVENSSLMPWLTATAFLHSVSVQEKRNTLKLWNILLVLFTFILTLLGTFITRSGVLNSVHAFAKSDIGPAFLAFIALVLIFSLIVIFWRLPLLESKHTTSSIICKENAFLINNLLFVGICFTVFYGTIFPLLAEGLANKKLSIQAPFFNKINIPFAILLISMMGITPFFAWKKASLSTLRKNLVFPCIIALCIMFVTYIFLKSSWILVFLSGAIYFSIFATLLEYQKIYLSRRNHMKTQDGFIEKMHSLFKNRRRWGGMIIHFGVLVLFIGFTGNFFGIEESFTLSPGEQKNIGSYTLRHIGEVQFTDKNAFHSGAKIAVYKNNKHLENLTPTKATYPTREEVMTEVAIHKEFFEDLYLSLASLNDDNSATIKVYINPLINLVWGSVLFLVLGTALCLSHKK